MAGKLSPIEGSLPDIIGSLDVRNRGALVSDFTKNLRVRGMSWPEGIEPTGDLPVRQVKSVVVERESTVERS